MIENIIYFVGTYWYVWVIATALSIVGVMFVLKADEPKQGLAMFFYRSGQFFSIIFLLSIICNFIFVFVSSMNPYQ